MVESNRVSHGILRTSPVKQFCVLAKTLLRDELKRSDCGGFGFCRFSDFGVLSGGIGDGFSGGSVHGFLSLAEVGQASHRESYSKRLCKHSRLFDYIYMILVEETR